LARLAGSGEDCLMTDSQRLKAYYVEVSLPVGRDEAWEAVTQPPVLRQWFGWDYEGLTAEIQQIFVSEASLSAPERMGWADGSYLEVVGDDDSSTVRAVREGDPSVPADRYDAIEEGWRAFLIQLRFLLDERPKGIRRTLYLTGETTGRQVLALLDADWNRVGDRTAWTVEDGGHLVVVSGHLHLRAHDAARVEVTVSTYGLDDDAFGAYREIWIKRWAPIASAAAITSGSDPAPL
jgi:uncharacterized protein YndB with AHSA1/START domain